MCVWGGERLLEMGCYGLLGDMIMSVMIWGERGGSEVCMRAS